MMGKRGPMIPDDLFRAYRGANLRFPQIEIGTVPVVADVMLRNSPEYMVRALTCDLSSKQVASLGASMDRVHHAWHIPARSRYGIPVCAPEQGDRKSSRL